MTDRELLEWAAKAAGWGKTKVDDRGWFYICTYPEPEEWELWDPLTDGDAALRLAVQLHMQLDLSDDGDVAEAIACPFGATEFYYERSSDKSDAARRAIVRAAAEIGKAQS